MKYEVDRWFVNYNKFCIVRSIPYPVSYEMYPWRIAKVTRMPCCSFRLKVPPVCIESGAIFNTRRHTRPAQAPAPSRTTTTPTTDHPGGALPALRWVGPDIFGSETETFVCTTDLIVSTYMRSIRKSEKGGITPHTYPIGMSREYLTVDLDLFVDQTHLSRCCNATAV